jgi:hypothetical protein
MTQLGKWLDDGLRLVIPRTVSQVKGTVEAGIHDPERLPRNTSRYDWRKVNQERDYMAGRLQAPMHSEESTEAVTAGPLTQFNFDLDTDLYDNTNLDISIDPALQNSEFNTDSSPPDNAEMCDDTR